MYIPYQFFFNIKTLRRITYNSLLGSNIKIKPVAKRRPNAKCGKKHVVPVCIERQNQTKYSQTKLIAKHGPSKCIIMARKEVEDGQNSFFKYS